MVDIERKGLTLQDWTKGMSADEFAGGSYFYAEGINSGYDTKGFELGHRLTNIAMNSRSDGYGMALIPNTMYGPTIFTYDGKIESGDEYNGNTKGAIFSTFDQGTGDRKYLNGIKYGDISIGIKQYHIDTIDLRRTISSFSQLLDEPTFGNSGANWTVGIGWTVDTDGAVHTTGNTGTLSATINGTFTIDDYLRIAIHIEDCTAGTVTMSADNGITYLNTSTAGTDGWYVCTLECTPSTSSVVITPSSTFDGTITEVDVYQYNNSYVHPDRTVLSTGGNSSLNRPAVIWEGDLYIGCGNRINIVNLDDWGKTYKDLVDKNFEIIDITQQAGNLIIWATDGYDSRQYYWNGVDAVATEIIEWKGLVIVGVTGTETLSYVLTRAGNLSEGYESRLYIVSGYTRQLIASKLYENKSTENIELNHYNKNKRFEFNDVKDGRSMCIFLDNLYIPGCDGIYKYGYDIPGLKSAWTRPIKYNTGSTNIVLGQRGVYLDIAYRNDGVNYIGEINNRLYCSTGYLVTSAIYWDKLQSRKALEKIKIGYRNVASTVGNIKIYAIVDDTYFWRFFPTVTPTIRPSVGDVYNIADNTTGKVIGVDTTQGIITFVTLSDKGSYANLANQILTKVSGAGDASITCGSQSYESNFDNMILLKTIETENQEYGADLIFGKNFVESQIPYWHKIQFVIELNSNLKRVSPEVYELSINSDISDTVL